MSADEVSITEHRNKKNKKANNTLIAYSFILPNLSYLLLCQLFLHLY